VTTLAYTSRGRTVPATPVPVSRSWAFGAGTGAGVRVCLVDSGVDPAVVAVAGSFRADAVGRVVADRGGDPAGHGTSCAAIIRGLAPGCELTSVRVLDGDLRGRGEALVAALRWALDQAFQVVNVSLSTTRPDLREPLRDLADRAYFTGTAIVAAAHNRPVASAPWPFPSVVSVGAHHADDPERIELNPQPPVEFFACGGTDGRRGPTGNSFAAAHLAGMCARILGAHPGLGVAGLKTVLGAVADNLEDTHAPQ